MAEYNHTQASGLATWTITHNLGQDTVVTDVFVDNGGDLEKIIPSGVEHTNDNTLTITFSSSKTGTARIVTVG